MDEAAHFARGISYHHRGGLETLSGSTIPQHFAGIADRFPDREALVGLPQGRRLTYRQLVDCVDELARGLKGVGFGRGDRIGVWSTNNIEWVVLQLATARIGAVLVTINPGYRPRELSHALKRSAVQGLFLIPAFRTSDYVEMLLDLIPELHERSGGDLEAAEFPALRRAVVYDPADPSSTDRAAPGLSTWREVIHAGTAVSAGALEEATAALEMDDAINIQYTSGTTGFPKAVVLSHHGLLNNALFCARALYLTQTDRLAVPVPFYHCFGMVLANLLCLSVGACIVIPCEHFEPLSVLQAIEAEGCTAVHGVPTMFVAMLDHPRFGDFDLGTLRTGIMAGAPCPPELMKRVMECMHCPGIVIGYGETEASPLTHLTSRDDAIERRVETVGRNLPHQEVKVVNVDTRRIVPIGEIGEICFRGYHLMKGYYGDAQATREAIDKNGWLASGDLGVMDEEGYLRITGRLKEMIIRSGENIYPREIEDVVCAHPAVAEVAVFGVPDTYCGEEIMAWIQLYPGERVAEGDIRRFCQDKLAHFKIPKYIRIVEEFPMTVTGKLQKYRMRELALRDLDQSEAG